jgi:hypothetical protein
MGSFVGDKAEKAMENQVFETGGYGAWIKYKAYRTWKSVSSGECCK